MNKLIEHVIDKFEELDWYHIGPTGKLVHGANSEEDDALYRAGDVYKLLDDLKAYSYCTKWTPCCEAKPPKTGVYLVTEKCGDVAQQYYITEDKHWAIETLPPIIDRRDQVPVAWMDMPKPWEGAEAENV